MSYQNIVCNQHEQDVFSGPAGGFTAWLARGANILSVWRKRAAERHQLLSLDDRILKDIGVTRAVAEAEADKPFWQE